MAKKKVASKSLFGVDVEIEKIAKLKPGDLLIITVPPEGNNSETADSIRIWRERMLPKDVYTVMISQGVSIKRMTDEQLYSLGLVRVRDTAETQEQPTRRILK